MRATPFLQKQGCVQRKETVRRREKTARQDVLPGRSRCVMSDSLPIQSSSTMMP
jgi:hypothetical protein